MREQERGHAPTASESMSDVQRDLVQSSVIQAASKWASGRNRFGRRNLPEGRRRGHQREAGRFGGELLQGREAMQGEREALVVVRPFPRLEGGHRGGEIRERGPAPELLLVDPDAALDLPVQLGPPRPDVPMVDPGRLDGQGKREGELGAAVGMELADRKR